jgi:hypothetical protein
MKDPRRSVGLPIEEPKFLGVIIQAPTGVVYEHQCGGTSCDQAATEGFFVPVARRELDESDLFSANRFALDTDLLRAVFHGDDDPEACVWTLSLDSMPAERLGRLAALVGLLCYHGADYSEMPITLDHSRLREGCEAWVPVMTPEGRAMLVWNNCD